jgi:ribose 1,5-bisphosphate isomerase
MIRVDDSIRAYLSSDAQKLFDDIVTQRVLGASAHIKMIFQMIRDLCSTARVQNETSDSLNTKIHQLADFFIQTRGESSQAITNVLVMITKGSSDQVACDLDRYIEFVLQQIDGFEQDNKRNLDLINQYAQCVLLNMNSILLFDYSSTVGRMIETCSHQLEIFIAESRALNGGKPYVRPALKGNHKVHFIPDAAIYFYLRQCDGVFIGAETYYSDGRVFNTIGTEMVASLCNVFHVPFYILTTLIKLDMRPMYGFIKPPLMLDLQERFSLDLDDEIQNQIDYSCPEVVEIPAKLITAFITEGGIVSPSAIFQLSTTYFKEIGRIQKND